MIMVLRKAEVIQSSNVLPFSTVRSLRNLQRLAIRDLAVRVYGADNDSARELAQGFRAAYIEPAYRIVHERLSYMMQ